MKKIKKFIPAILLNIEAVILVSGILLMIDGVHNKMEMLMGIAFVVVSSVAIFVPYLFNFKNFGLFDGEVIMPDEKPREQPATTGAIFTIMSKVKLSSFSDKELQMYEQLLRNEMLNVHVERTYRTSKALKQKTDDNGE